MNRADVLRKLRAALEPQRDLPFRLAYSRDEVLEALAHAAQVEERLEAGASPMPEAAPSPWYTAQAMLSRFGPEGLQELTVRGLLEWRGDHLQLTHGRLKVDVPGSEVRSLPAVRSGSADLSSFSSKKEDR